MSKLSKHTTTPEQEEGMSKLEQERIERNKNEEMKATALNSTHPNSELVPQSLPRVFSVSGGRSSAYLLWRMKKEGFKETDIFLFENTGKERPETLDFLHMIETYWGIPLIWLEFDLDIPTGKPTFKVVDYYTASMNGEPFKKLILLKKYLPNVVKRLCTYDLKVKTAQRYLKSIGVIKHQNICGIRADEPIRAIKMDVQNLSGGNHYHYVLPLVAWGVNKVEVNEFWKTNDFDLTISSEEGNCDLCFLKGTRKIVNLIRQNPSAADWWIDQEELTGSKFIKGTSFADLKRVALNQMQLPFETGEIECMCNAD